MWEPLSSSLFVGPISIELLNLLEPNLVCHGICSRVLWGVYVHDKGTNPQWMFVGTVLYKPNQITKAGMPIAPQECHTKSSICYQCVSPYIHSESHSKVANSWWLLVDLVFFFVTRVNVFMHLSCNYLVRRKVTASVWTTIVLFLKNKNKERERKEKRERRAIWTDRYQLISKPKADVMLISSEN